jgi:co-chaperonin GroES (HSP10)
MRETKIRPIGPLVLVKLAPKVEQDLGNLIMPATSDEGLKRAIIVDYGTKDIPEQIEVGKTVVVPKNLRNELDIDGVKHYLLPIEEILAIERTIET